MKIHGFPFKIFDPFIMGEYVAGWSNLFPLDLVGSMVMHSSRAATVRVFVEIEVSYLDAGLPIMHSVDAAIDRRISKSRLAVRNTNHCCLRSHLHTTELSPHLVQLLGVLKQFSSTAARESSQLWLRLAFEGGDGGTTSCASSKGQSPFDKLLQTFEVNCESSLPPMELLLDIEAREVSS